MTSRNDGATTTAIAVLFEDMAASREQLMPNVHALQSTTSIIEAYVARNLPSGGRRDGSVASCLGLDRIESARRRISDATYDLEDDVRRHGLLG